MQSIFKGRQSTARLSFCHFNFWTPSLIVKVSTTYLYPSFQGLMSDNDTIRLGLDFQRMLRINHMLYIAARDHVFAVNLGTSSEQIIPQQYLFFDTDTYFVHI
ncbi:hypothetical protein AMECASPLE_031630 [Ameca splendens]|uniref:Uncharacterized protein n=1 Tax=Ameca splendens TaxID=208324 RepID=A0ABV0Z546_9TELE